MVKIIVYIMFLFIFEEFKINVINNYKSLWEMFNSSFIGYFFF